MLCPEACGRYLKFRIDLPCWSKIGLDFYFVLLPLCSVLL